MDLHSEIEPYETGRLAVGDGHTLYWEQCGAPDGVPVVFLHGGPGSGSAAVHRRFFDPGHYRIVLFDQRGAGRSVPHASIDHNTTAHLVADLERLRRRLGIERWIVFGGSWGSTLALAYGEAHPERCLGFVLRGVFLARPEEIDWFVRGMGAFFPEAWREFAAFVPEAERGDLLAAYHRRLADPDPLVHLPAARAWGRYEARCSTLLPNPALVEDSSGDAHVLSLSRIESHYFVNRAFLPPGGLLGGLGAVARHPCIIVQGRYDMVCPARTADELARAWPGSRLVIVPDAGHSAMEPGIRTALVGAMESFKRLA